MILQQIINSEVSYELPQKIHSDIIFDNVYNQLKPARAYNIHKQVALFLEDLATGAQMHIAEVELAGTTNQQIYASIWQQMGEYINRYQNSSRFKSKLEEVSGIYNKLTKHVNFLVKQGEVEPLVAKVFLTCLSNLKPISSSYYNQITKNNEDISPEELKAKNQIYAQVAEKIYNGYPEGTKQEQSGSFYHLNCHLETTVKNRIYISAKLSAFPEQLIQAWQRALEETNLKDKIYYKIPVGLSKRSETIIFYITDKTDQSETEKLLVAFNQECPIGLLSQKSMPTGIPLSPGICLTPEPRNINTFIRCSGVEDIISYNELISALTKLSFELSYYNYSNQGFQNSDITPKILTDKAKIYFKQMIKLAGINPDTMIPNSQQESSLLWAKNLISLN